MSSIITVYKRISDGHLFWCVGQHQGDKPKNYHGALVWDRIVWNVERVKYFTQNFPMC